jgi:hypothetical protein
VVIGDQDAKRWLDRGRGHGADAQRGRRAAATGMVSERKVPCPGAPWIRSTAVNSSARRRRLPSPCVLPTRPFASAACGESWLPIALHPRYEAPAPTVSGHVDRPVGPVGALSSVSGPLPILKS